MPYKKKLGFADFEYKHDCIIDNTIIDKLYIDRYKSQNSTGDAWGVFINQQASLYNETCLFDVFKLLGGEVDFKRITK